VGQRSGTWFSPAHAVSGAFAGPGRPYPFWAKMKGSLASGKVRHGGALPTLCEWLRSSARGTGRAFRDLRRSLPRAPLLTAMRPHLWQARFLPLAEGASTPPLQKGRGPPSSGIVFSGIGFQRQRVRVDLRGKALIAGSSGSTAQSAKVKRPQKTLVHPTVPELDFLNQVIQCGATVFEREREARLPPGVGFDPAADLGKRQNLVPVHGSVKRQHAPP